MTVTQTINLITSGGCDNAFASLYGKERVSVQRERWIKLANSFLSLYGDSDVCMLSVPGRTELLGNHTDHNNGKVLAAAVDIDIIAIAAKAEDNYIRIKSEGYREDVVCISDISPEKAKKGSSSSVISGVCDYFLANGGKVGGIRACTTSDVLTGSGISSSAAFEVMCGNMLNNMYNDNKFTPLFLAMAGKYAENVYFGKPCGLMDQTACASGGCSFIDFGGEVASLRKITPDLGDMILCIVNTGGNHADLTDDYASVPSEMHSCAALMGKKTLREVDENEFISRISVLRANVGDRAIMRALHYFAENRRVDKAVKCLENGDTAGYFLCVTESGNSSFRFLQNVYTNKNVSEQGLSLALALTERMGLTCRVHGGGFAGTIQTYLPVSFKEEYRTRMERVFGEGSCMFLNIRPFGAALIDGENIIEAN
ncbi:MAG: galactokinase [Clostridia bacterium]|nr:galactokinase [Clostridia bacterium]